MATEIGAEPLPKPTVIPLGGAFSGCFIDDEFCIQNNVDETKVIMFDITNVGTTTTRIINIDNDQDIHLGVLTNRGDLLTRNDTRDTRYAIGNENNVLNVNSTGDIEWTNTLDLCRVNKIQTDDYINNIYYVTSTHCSLLRVTTTGLPDENKTVRLPLITTLPKGWTIHIINHRNSHERVDVQTSTGTAIQTLGIGAHSIYTSPDDATAAWRTHLYKCENIIRVAKSGGDFISLQTAVLSIVGNNPITRFIVEVCPGIYKENTITCKDYVTIMGTGTGGATSVIKPIDDVTALPMFIISETTNCEISDLTFAGNGPGSNTVFSIDNSSGVEINRCVFETFDIGLNVNASASSSTVYMKENKFRLAYNNAIRINNPANAASVQSFDDHFDASNVNVEVIRVVGSLALYSATSSIWTGNVAMPASTAIYANDGGRVNLLATIMSYFAKGIHFDSSGGGGILTTAGIVIRSNGVNDIHIDNPGTTGNIQGVMDKTKITINPLANVSINFADAGDLSTVIAEGFFLGNKFGDIVEVTDLIVAGIGMGISAGGGLTFGANSYEIDMQAGLGYVMVSGFALIYDTFPDHTIKKIRWDAETINFTTHADVSGTGEYWIYFDNIIDLPLTVRLATSLPNIKFNIIIGRVKWDAVASLIEFIDQSRVSMHHDNNNNTRKDREVYGSRFASGCIGNEGATALSLEVSSGSYFYSHNKFRPLGIDTDTNHETAKTAQAGTASTITFQALSNSSDDYYCRYYIQMTSGAANGDIRRIINYVGSTLIATVSPAFTGTPVTDTYNIIDGFVRYHRSHVTPFDWTYDDGIQLVSNTQYNPLVGGGPFVLTSIPAGEWVKHALYVVNDGDEEKWMFVYGQESFASLALAQAGGTPVQPVYFQEGVVLVLCIIVQQGNANIVEIIDCRPVAGGGGGGGGGVSDHGLLTGLIDDDHLQYLHINGALEREMKGDFGMGGYDIINVNLVDGVDVDDHSTRHNPNSGTDPLTTAAPDAVLGYEEDNSVGTNNSFARSDHEHAFSPIFGDSTTTSKIQIIDSLVPAGTNKVWDFSSAAIATSNTRTLTMSDYNLALDLLVAGPATGTANEGDVAVWTLAGSLLAQTNRDIATSIVNISTIGIVTGVTRLDITPHSSSLDNVSINLFPSTAAGLGPSSLLFYEQVASGTNTVGFKAPNTIAGDVLWTLPDAHATNANYALVSDTFGILSWAGVGLCSTNGTDNYLTKWNGDSCELQNSTIEELNGEMILHIFSGAVGEIRFNDLNESAYVGFKSPNSVTGSVTWSLPPADGTVNQGLITNGGTALSWTDVALCAGASIENVVPKWSSTTCQLQDSSISEALNIVSFNASSGISGQILIFEDTDNGANYIGFKPPDAASSSVVYEFPEAGTEGSALVINTSGSTTILEWTTNPPVECAGTSAVNVLTKWSSTDCDLVSSSISEALNIVSFNASSGISGQILIFEDTDNGSNYIGFKPPDAVSSSVVYEFPEAGTEGSALVINTSGSTTILEWTTNPPVECAVTPTANRVSKWSGSGCNLINSTIESLASGVVSLLNGPMGVQGELHYNESLSYGSNYVGFKAPSNLSGASQIWTLPPIDGTPGQQLTTTGNGNGELSWSNCCTSTVNDNFACCSAGENIIIDVVANDVNVNIGTVAFVKLPEHHFGTLTVNGSGEVSYTANTRYTGHDWFTYEVVDSTTGVLNPHKGVVHIDIRSDKPSVASPITKTGARFIYGEATGTKDVRQYNDGNSTLIFRPGSPRFANGLATNRDDNLIYYAYGTAIYAYDYITDELNNTSGTDDWLVTDIANYNNSEHPFKNAVTNEGGPITIGSSTGATYYNGIYYMGGRSNDTDGYYRIVMAPYAPGSKVQEILDVHYIIWSDSLDINNIGVNTRTLSDMAWNHNSGMLMVCSNESSGAHEAEIALVDPSTGVVHHTMALDNVSGIGSYQLTWGAAGEILMCDYTDVFPDPGGTDLRTLNCQSGRASDTLDRFSDVEIYDLAEWISQPCN